MTPSDLASSLQQSLLARDVSPPEANDVTQLLRGGVTTRDRWNGKL